MVVFEDYLASIDNLSRLSRASVLKKRDYGPIYVRCTLNSVKKKRGILLIAEHNGKIIGFAVGLIHKQSMIQKIELKRKTRFGYLSELYIDRKYRGTGVAKDLICGIENYFKEKSCDTFTTDVFAPNARARRFYEKLGFVERSIGLLKEI